jgi:hypothetical protein
MQQLFRCQYCGAPAAAIDPSQQSSFVCTYCNKTNALQTPPAPPPPAAPAPVAGEKVPSWPQPDGPPKITRWPVPPTKPDIGIGVAIGVVGTPVALLVGIAAGGIIGSVVSVSLVLATATAVHLMERNDLKQYPTILAAYKKHKSRLVAHWARVKAAEFGARCGAPDVVYLEMRLELEFLKDLNDASDYRSEPSGQVVYVTTRFETHVAEIMAPGSLLEVV